MSITTAMGDNRQKHTQNPASRLWRKSRLVVIACSVALLIVGLLLITRSELVTPKSFAQDAAGGFGFDLRASTVNVQQIRSGGPAKDGIPALTGPEFLETARAAYLRPNDRVIGVTIKGDTRAYPLAILNYHEIVNDTVGGTPVVVTYCPLCDSAAVFDRRTPLGEREFGVSGLLYNSNLLMYDRRGQPESLWSQVQSAGISGPGAGKRLTALPSELTTWESWKTRYPDSLVMSARTGHQRDYRRNPYEHYFTNQQLMFPAQPVSQRLPNKERVLGVWVSDQFRAYPESRFPLDQRRITDTIAGKKLTVEFDLRTRTLRVAKADDGVEWLYSFWFAWYALHPETSVYGDVNDPAFGR